MKEVSILVSMLIGSFCAAMGVYSAMERHDYSTAAAIALFFVLASIVILAFHK